MAARLAEIDLFLIPRVVAPEPYRLAADSVVRRERLRLLGIIGLAENKRIGNLIGLARKVELNVSTLTRQNGSIRSISA